MLITSKEKKYDYMDSIASLGVDKTCVWNRDSHEYGVIRDLSMAHNYSSFYLELDNGNKLDLSYLPRPMKYSVWDNKGKNVNFERLYLGFCGETFKIFIKYGEYTYTPQGEGVLNKEIFFNPTDEEIEVLEDKKHTYKPKRYREKQNEQPFNAEIFSVLRTPIFLYREIAKELKILTNPILKDLEFYRMYDSYSAFQKISQYISGVLGNTEKPLIQISDKDQLVAKGFDKKTSFRHPVK